VAYYFAFFFLLIVVVFLLYTIQKIKVARHFGKKLPKRNLYYAFVAKVFMKDLPD
jgi:predicted RND superfamily exporter protein